MPAYMPNLYYVKFYVFAYANLYTCYSAIVSMPVKMLSSVSTYMPNALSHMLDCNMPNAMTIAMSFSMTTEQIGYLITYMSITRLWLSILPL
jgi:hypothetical protein